MLFAEEKMYFEESLSLCSKITFQKLYIFLCRTFIYLQNIYITYLTLVSYKNKKKNNLPLVKL